MSDEQDRYLQNDPDRAGGLIKEPPGGAFDPRAFRGAESTEPVDPPSDEGPTGRPPMDGIRMSSPGEEIDKAG